MDAAEKEDREEILIDALDGPSPEDETSKKADSNPYDWFSSSKKDDNEEDEDEDEVDGDEETSADDDSDADDDSSSAAAKPESRQADVGLVARAIQAGLKPDRIAGMSADVLESAVEVLEEAMGSKSKDEEKEPEKFKLKLNAEEYDDEVIGQLNEMNDYYHASHQAMLAEIKELKKAREDDSERIQRESNNRFISWVDNRFVEMAEADSGYAEIFGKSKVDDLKENSSEFKKRVAVIQEIGRQRRAHPEYSDVKLLDVAIKVALSDDVSKIAEGKIRSKVKNHKEDRVSVRSTGKERITGKTPEPISKGVKSAENFVKRFLKKAGVS